VLFLTLALGGTQRETDLGLKALQYALDELQIEPTTCAELCSLLSDQNTCQKIFYYGSLWLGMTKEPLMNSIILDSWFEAALAFARQANSILGTGMISASNGSLMELADYAVVALTCPPKVGQDSR
jgi:hypothetical protein